MKNLSILGSTGSIGRNCLRVIEDFPAQFAVAGLAAGSNSDLLAKQVERFRPRIVSVSGWAAAESLGDRTQHLPPASRPRIVLGVEGMIELATLPEIDLVVSAVVGVSGLIPTLEAIGCGKTIA